MSDKPLGWRPFTQERRKELREGGIVDEAVIDAMEANNVYSPINNAVWSTELALAVFEACAQRHGPEFVGEVRRNLERRAEKLASSDLEEDQVEAPMVRDLIEAVAWDAITSRASDAAISRGE